MKATEKTRELYEKAKKGDMKAGRELIRECRRGMVKPYWETPQRLTEKVVKEFIARRQDLAGKPKAI